MSNDTRRLANWLDGYLEYTAETESSPTFHLWCGISAIASALRKKSMLQNGRLTIYPNLYIILVAEPGVARKTQAIDYSIDITSQLDSIVRAADATTRESLIQGIEKSEQDHMMADGTVFKHNSLSIVSRELEDFLGNKKENHRMVTTLTALYDCGTKPWIYQTKNSGTNKLSSVFVNLIAATTPESLASCLPASAVGGGLTTRIIFVWSGEKTKKYSKPPRPPELLSKALVQDLEIIARNSGAYTLSRECDILWDRWYNKFDGESIYRTCKDRIFSGWYSRKSTMILKLAMVLAAAKSNSLIIEWSIIEEAISIIEKNEIDMAKSFCAVGRSDVTLDVATICTIVEKYLTISEKQLLHLVWRDIDSNKFDNVVSTAIRCGYMVKEILDGRIMYRAITEEERLKG